MNNPFKTEGDNVNAFELVQSIAFLLETNQWNDVTKFSAATTPKDFIKMVESFRGNEESVKLLGPQEVDLWIMENGINRISVIKVIRELGMLGLADSKFISDNVPCKLFRSMYDSDVLVAACYTLHTVGARVMLKHRATGETMFEKFNAGAVNTPASFVRNGTHTCPQIDKLF